jgi:hypothetical protein
VKAQPPGGFSARNSEDEEKLKTYNATEERSEERLRREIVTTEKRLVRDIRLRSLDE